MSLLLAAADAVLSKALRAVGAAEVVLFSFYFFAVASFIDFASAVVAGN